MKPFSFPLILAALFLLATGDRPAMAAMSFCNNTAGALEAALGYRLEARDKESWVSEGWWRLEPGQCARVYAAPLNQRFYFYYAHTLTDPAKDAAPTEWKGKYVFCTNTKAFRIEGDGDCVSRKYQSVGFQEIDVGRHGGDYTLNFRDKSSRSN